MASQFTMVTSRNPLMLRRSSRRSMRRRSGAAAVEFALVASVLFMTLFGAIEFARLNQVVNATANAAYAGCRKAIIPGATVANASTSAQAILSANFINGATITVNPSSLSSSTTTVTVTIAVPVNSNSWSVTAFSKNMTITRSCTLTREKTN